ncbi:MAG: RluA family pseudouridine synthase [Bacteroidales bacterium]
MDDLLTDGALPEEEQENSEDQELFEHYRIEVDKGQGLLRIDKFLMTRIENATRTKIQQAAHAGNILVNNDAVKPNYRVKPADVITIVLPSPPREIEIIPEDIPLNIVFEDEYLMVVNKPAGLVVHPGYGNYHGTLLNAATWHIMHTTGATAEDSVPYLVHRIDKNTSGLLLIAKDELTQSRLARQFADHSIDRIYHALVWGAPPHDEGTITGHVGRSQRDRKVMDVYPDGDHGKHATTHYRVIEKFGYVTLLECRLETGRTHQIRAHFRYTGNPLFNDETYGGNHILKGTTFSRYKQFIHQCFDKLPRHALHALTLGFEHPHTRQKVHFSSVLPGDFASILDDWRHYSSL